MGRHALGYDIDPLARLIAQVKSCEVDDEPIEQAYKAVISQTVKDLNLLNSMVPPLNVRERATPPISPIEIIGFALKFQQC